MPTSTRNTRAPLRMHSHAYAGSHTLRACAVQSSEILALPSQSPPGIKEKQC